MLCSNCTFMELKYDEEVQSEETSLCSNCTFMELKFEEISKCRNSFTVLIVPLWN